MADPIVDERYLMAALDAPASLAAVEDLQSSALVAVIDAWDRKILRDPFVALTASAFSLHTQLGRLHMVARIHEMFKQDKLTDERLTDADLQLLAFCEAERISLVKLASLVAQCPTSAVSVH
jgi:hypothetical protein